MMRSISKILRRRTPIVNLFVLAIMRRLAWERINADVIENPICELEFQVCQFGHLPAFPEGKDCKKCKLLYC